MQHGTRNRPQIGAWTTRDTVRADREAREQYAAAYLERHGVELATGGIA